MGEKRSKRSILVDEKGVPLAIILSGVNVHDSKLLDKTLRSIVISKDESVVENLCLDAGYVGSFVSTLVNRSLDQGFVMSEILKIQPWESLCN